MGFTLSLAVLIGLFATVCFLVCKRQDAWRNQIDYSDSGEGGDYAPGHSCHSESHGADYGGDHGGGDCGHD